MKLSKPILISTLVTLFFLGAFIIPIPSATLRQTHIVPLAEFGDFAGSLASRTFSQTKKSENLARRLARDAARKAARAAMTSTVTYRIKPGDTFSRILARYQAPPETASLVEKALRENGAAEKLRIGEEISLVFAKSGKLRSFKRNLSGGRLLELRSSPSGGYNIRLIEPKIVEEERLVSGSIQSSLAQAASAFNVPYSIIDELADVLGSKINFSRDLQPGDTFTVLYSERRTENGIILKAGPLKAAAVNSGGNMFAAVRYTGKDGRARYYDREGKPFGSYFLKYPVSFTRVSSVFSDNRLHPVLKTRRPHNGVDFAAPHGTPVRAVADGVVDRAGYYGASGNMVMIRHDHRYTTGYLHLAKFAPGIRKGTYVKRGQHIGNVGTTGLSTGPHLHFSLFDRGRYTDPMKANLPMLTPKEASIPQQYLASILDTLRAEHKRVVVAANSSQSKSRS